MLLLRNSTVFWMLYVSLNSVAGLPIPFIDNDERQRLRLVILVACHGR